LHNPINSVLSFAILISIVGASFYYVSTNEADEPWLGIEGSNLTPSIAQSLGLQQTDGFLIFSVEPGSPAEHAGLKGGDRLLTVDGRPVVAGGDLIISVDNIQIKNAQDIEGLLTHKAVGDFVDFGVVRGGSTLEFRVQLAAK
jgi:serine protease Do